MYYIAYLLLLPIMSMRFTYVIAFHSSSFFLIAVHYFIIGITHNIFIFMEDIRIHSLSNFAFLVDVSIISFVWIPGVGLLSYREYSYREYLCFASVDTIKYFSKFLYQFTSHWDF